VNTYCVVAIEMVRPLPENASKGNHLPQMFRKSRNYIKIAVNSKVDID
jgi:hypothetical protein